MLKKLLVLYLLLIVFLAASAVASFKLSGTTKSNAFLEILEVTDSPVYTIANGGVTNAKLYKNSNGNALTFNADAAGNISYSYGENEETPLPGGGNIGPKSLIIRAWDGVSAGQGKYCYSQSFSLGKSMQGVQSIPLSFTGWFTQGAPLDPAITATQTGYNMSDPPQPIVSCALDISKLTAYEIIDKDGGKFNYKVFDDKNIKNEENDTNTTAFLLDSSQLIAGKTYAIEVFARNGFGNGTIGKGSIPTKTLGAAGGTLEQTLTFKPGINSFGMPFPAPWYIHSNKIENAFQLLQEINSSGGNVTSFGLFDATGQTVTGYTFNVISEKQAELESIKLGPGIGYQLFTNGEASVTIKNVQ